MGSRPDLPPANAPAATGPAGKLVSSIGPEGSLDPSPGSWFTALVDGGFEPGWKRVFSRLAA